jgi:N-glycosylase/DNA lyase
VDVHVWNIARRDYDADGVLVDVKSLTPSVYRQVGDLFRSRFPEQAGWAHSLLFVAELPSFRPILPDDIVLQMNKFRDLEQEKKEAARDAKREKK